MKTITLTDEQFDTLFEYVDDKVCKSEIKKFTEYCINFIDSLDYEN